MRKIRIISFLMLAALAFAPLGSCTVKTARTAGGASMSFQKEGSGNLKQGENEQLSEIRMIDFSKKSGSEGAENISVMVFLLISFLGVGFKKLPFLVKPVVWVSVIFSGLSYALFSVCALLAPVTTVYGYLFIVVGLVYFSVTVNSLLPSALRITWQ